MAPQPALVRLMQPGHLAECLAMSALQYVHVGAPQVAYPSSWPIKLAQDETHKLTVPL